MTGPFLWGCVSSVYSGAMLQGPHLLLGDVRHAEEHGPAPRVRQQVPGQTRLQEADPHEPAH